jgi:hypothetical protein
MSKNKLIVLQRIPGHCDITGKEEADALAKEGHFDHTKYRQGIIPCCQSHNSKEFSR